MRIKAFFSLLALAASCGLSASAAVVTSFDFNSPIVTGAVQAPGTFYTDRYAPAGFATSGGELVVSISSNDSQSNRPAAFNTAFYNTQGRKYDLAPGAKTIEADLFVDTAWLNSGQREAGLWGTAFNAGNAISFYPIIEYALGGFRGWNGSGYVNLGAGNVGVYNTLGIELDETLDVWKYLVNGAVMGSVAANGSNYIGNVIFQAHNNYGQGVDARKEVRWDNFSATDGNNVPEPGTLALAGISLIGLGFISRRREQLGLPLYAT